MPVHRHPVAHAKSDDLGPVPVDRALAARLRESYAAIRRSDVRLAEIFYTRLFETEPGLRAMFHTEPAEQAKKLMASLDAIVRNLESPRENAAMLAALGKRHASYGVRAEHYPVVTKILVDSMRELLGPGVDEQSLEEWRLALGLISKQMIDAGSST